MTIDVNTKMICTVARTWCGVTFALRLCRNRPFPLPLATPPIQSLLPAKDQGTTETTPLGLLGLTTSPTIPRLSPSAPNGPRSPLPAHNEALGHRSTHLLRATLHYRLMAPKAGRPRLTSHNGRRATTRHAEAA